MLMIHLILSKVTILHKRQLLLQVVLKRNMQEKFLI